MGWVICLICGAVCAVVASSKGRNAVGWFFAGFFLTLIGLILVLVVSNLKEQENQRLRLETEQRRLSEQLRQERLKNEALRQHVTTRLDVHDQVLNIDTRGATALPGGATAGYLPDGESQGAPRPMLLGAAGVPSSAQQLPAADPDEKRWYYHWNGSSIGPISENDLAQMFVMQRLPPVTLVWSQDLGQWTPAQRVSIFRPVTGS